TYLSQLATNSNVLYADAGGAPAGTSPYDLTKADAIFRGEVLMHIAAHNIGAAEAALGANYLRDAQTRLKIPFLSANVRDGTGQLIAPASRLISIGQTRIALIGVLSPTLAPKGITISDPRAAIVATAATLKAKSDLIVVLGYLPDQELEQLASSLPESDAVIGGPTGQAIKPRRVGPALLAAATNKGKFLVELTHAPADKGFSTGKVTELGLSFADDPTQLANLKTYLAQLAEKDFPADQTGLVSALPPGVPKEYRIAGSASCKECHPSAHNTWTETAHARAFATLQTKGFAADPACLQCHTTGYGLPGGFRSPKRTPLQASVGCENCHGPSQAHVSNPKTRTPFQAPDQCLRCHDHENSPKFVYSDYWPKIAHAQEKILDNSQTKH
ncbi:MAG TPA: multiheme c-type cytochrome, partial [Tepidisphaeraceae bacterium]